MSIDSVIEFIQSETPENEELLISAFRSVHYLLNMEQDCIDGRISELLLERDYDRVTEYVKMSKTVSEIFSYVNGMINKYGLDDEQAIAECPEENLETINELPEDDIEILSGEKRVNYENFRVDENVAYNLMTDFRYMRPAAFSLDGVRYPARLWKLVLLKTCELLWEKNHSIFENFVDDKFMRGKTRTYFSRDKETMGKPELVNGTEIFVETNLSANSIRDLIVKMLDKYRIPHATYQIYLSKDLNPLHIEDNKPNDINTKDTVTTKVLDMQEICDAYDYKTGKCMNESSPYFIMECCKKENCSYIQKKQYQVIQDEQKIGKIYVLPKKILKKKICPQCGNEMERTIFPVEFENENEMKCNNVYGCWCQNCSRSYITEGTYRSFITNKKEEKIKVTFVKEENGQLSLF